MSSFVKPNIDKTLYLWSKNAKKVIQGKESELIKYPKVLYNATSPDITFSSVLTDRDAFKLFDGVSFTLASSYVSDPTYDISTTNYTGTKKIIDVHGEDYSGEWIRIDLKENIVLKEYKIFPEDSDIDKISRAPGTFRIYGSIDGTTHYFIDERVDQIYSVGNGLTFSIPNNQEYYRYYTIVVNKTSQPSTFGRLLFSEWELYGTPLIQYPKTFYTAPSSDITASSWYNLNYPHLLFDGMKFTSIYSWVASNKYDATTTEYIRTENIVDVNNETYYGEWVRIDLKENIVLKEYKIFPQDGSEDVLAQGPGSFRIYGSTDNITHHFIDERVNQIYSTGNGLTFSLPHNQEYYRYYTLIVNKIAQSNPYGSLRVSEWELYGVPTEKCLEYNWVIPEITLNQSGKISMEAKAYNSFTPSTTAVSTRIKNISSKYNYDTANGGGTILNIGHWGSKSKMIKCPPIPLQPQSINEISLSLTPENDTERGLQSSADFVVVLKITEDDVPPVEWGNSKAVNVRQLSIPTYN